MTFNCQKNKLLYPPPLLYYVIPFEQMHNLFRAELLCKRQTTTGSFGGFCCCGETDRSLRRNSGEIPDDIKLNYEMCNLYSSASLVEYVRNIRNSIIHRRGVHKDRRIEMMAIPLWLSPKTLHTRVKCLQAWRRSEQGQLIAPKHRPYSQTVA